MLVTKIVSSQEKVFVDDSIEKFATLEKITALGGERLSLQFIYVDTAPSYIPVRPICDLQLEGELAKYATVRDVRSVPVDRPVNIFKYDENYLRTTPGIYPDILTPLRYGGKVVISREKLRSLWVEIEIPEDFSGDTTLTLSVFLKSGSVGDTGEAKFDGEAIATQSVKIDVLSASLPEQTLLHTQWFYPDCLASYYRVPAWSEEHWRIVEAFAGTAAKRGRNVLYTTLLTPALNVLPPFHREKCQLVDVEVVDGEYKFNFDNVGRWVDMCDRVGIKYFEISHFYDQHKASHGATVYAKVGGEEKMIFGWDTLSEDPEYVRFLRAMIKEFLSYMKARGADKRCFFHISDEPSTEYIDRFNKIKGNIEDLLEGYTIMDALSDIDFYNIGAVTEPVPVTTHAMPFIEAGVKNLWVYYACNEVIEYSNCYLAMPSWRTRSIGMQLYKYNLKGFLHWGYNYYNNRASGDAINPYLDLGGEDWVNAGDTFMVYPNNDGTPLESIRLMTMEEAMQDVRAMQLAEKYYSHEEVVAAMEEALGDEITFTRCAHTADEMLRVREAVNELIRRGIGN